MATSSSTQEKGVPVPFWKKLLMGSSSGAIGSAVGLPAEVRIRSASVGIRSVYVATRSSCKSCIRCACARTPTRRQILNAAFMEPLWSLSGHFRGTLQKRRVFRGTLPKSLSGRSSEESFGALFRREESFGALFRTTLQQSLDRALIEPF